MRLLAVACLVLLAPKGTYELKYRFPKGMVYEDTQTRAFTLEVVEKDRKFRTAFTSRIQLRRTILDVDENAHPMVERVKVLAFHVDVTESPTQEDVGITREACEGSTFVWRRMKTRWLLFDDSGDVTAKHEKLVNQLKNWRDARLPQAPQRVGGTWEVPAAKFLRTAGMKVPKDVSGIAQFVLEKVEKDTATIPFRIHYTFRNPQGSLGVTQKGVWRFDVARGRDLSFAMTGEVKIDGGKKGSGELKLRRSVTYVSG